MTKTNSKTNTKKTIPENKDRRVVIFNGKETPVFDDIYADADDAAPYGYTNSNKPYKRHHFTEDEYIQTQVYQFNENNKEVYRMKGSVSKIDPEIKAEIRRLYETTHMSMVQLKDDFEIPRETIKTWVQKEGWKRPDDYNPVLAWWHKDVVKQNIENLKHDQQVAITDFLELISEGVPLKRALKQVNRRMSSFQNWKQTIEGFEQSYKTALVYFADSSFSEGISILDDSTNEYGLNFKHAKVLSDQKLKVASILAPMTYSEKARLDITSNDESIKPLPPAFNIVAVKEFKSNPYEDDVDVNDNSED